MSKFFKCVGVRLGVSLSIPTNAASKLTKTGDASSNHVTNGRIRADNKDAIEFLKESGYTLEPHDGFIPEVDYEALEAANRNMERIVWKSSAAEAEYKAAQAAQR